MILIVGPKPWLHFVLLHRIIHLFEIETNLALVRVVVAVVLIGKLSSQPGQIDLEPSKIWSALVIITTIHTAIIVVFINSSVVVAAAPAEAVINCKKIIIIVIIVVVVVDSLNEGMKISWRKNNCIPFNLDTAAVCNGIFKDHMNIAAAWQPTR